MKRLMLASVAAAWMACGQAAAAESATCTVKGSFDGVEVPGAVAAGEVRADAQLKLDLFGANPQYAVLITLTQGATGGRLTVAIADTGFRTDVFLETTLGATVLGVMVDGEFDGRKLDDISLLCTAAG